MTLFDHIDATTPEYGVRIGKLREEIKVMRGCIRELVRARVNVADFLEEAKREYVEAAVTNARGNRSKAGLMIGMHRNRTYAYVPSARKKPCGSSRVAASPKKAGER